MELWPWNVTTHCGHTCCGQEGENRLEERCGRQSPAAKKGSQRWGLRRNRIEMGRKGHPGVKETGITRGLEA